MTTGCRSQTRRAPTESLSGSLPRNQKDVLRGHQAPPVVVDNVTKVWEPPSMKTRSIVEDVSGSLNRRYFAEVEVDNDINVRREGHSTAEAAQKVVASIRYQADAAERKFVRVRRAAEDGPVVGQRLEDTARALGWRHGLVRTATSLTRGTRFWSGSGTCRRIHPLG